MVLAERVAIIGVLPIVQVIYGISDILLGVPLLRQCPSIVVLCCVGTAEGFVDGEGVVS